MKQKGFGPIFLWLAVEEEAALMVVEYAGGKPNTKMHTATIRWGLAFNNLKAPFFIL